MGPSLDQRVQQNHDDQVFALAAAMAEKAPVVPPMSELSREHRASQVQETIDANKKPDIERESWGAGWIDKPKATLSGRDPVLSKDYGAPDVIDPATGMHKDYWVLPEEDRKKGWVRPFRNTYLHVGIRPVYATRDLSIKEHQDYDQFGYVAYEPYPRNPDKGGSLGKYWTAKDLKSGCQGKTSMGRALAETYARDPKYYGSTFCCHCRTHHKVEEFVWVGTDERVGS